MGVWRLTGRSVGESAAGTPWKIKRLSGRSRSRVYTVAQGRGECGVISASQPSQPAIGGGSRRTQTG